MADAADTSAEEAGARGRLRSVDNPGPVSGVTNTKNRGTDTGKANGGKKRVVVNRQKDRPGQFLKLRGLLDQPTLWEHAATIPAQASGGAPRKLPEIFYLLMPSLVAIWGSFSKAEATITERDCWEILCRMVCELQPTYRPQDEPFDLDRLMATSPLTAQNFYDARRSWLSPHLESLQAMFEQHAAHAALEVGHADPTGPGSVNNLTRSRTLSGDGKVTREPRSRYSVLDPVYERGALGISRKTHVMDTSTGQIVAAANMEGDAHLYNTGDGPVVGYKTVRLSLRNDETNDTIILAVKRPSSADEAGCAVDAALEIKDRLPGVLGITYDTALRGTHIARLAREGGLVTAAPVAAKSVNKATGARTEKTGYLATVPHERPDGTPCVHEFHHHGGQLRELRTDSHGKRSLVPCDDPKVEVRTNKKSFRMYLEWTITCSAGHAPGEITKLPPLRWTVTDDRTDFNVAENLRALPPGSSRYAQARGWRQTSENDNNQSDAAKNLRRGRSSRPDWNHVNEIGWALVQNGVALQRHRARQALATEEPAAA